MSAIVPGMNMKLIDDSFLCTFSVAQELFLIVGNLLLVKKCCEILMSREVVDAGLEPLPVTLSSKLKSFELRTLILDRFYSRRVREAVSLIRRDSNVRELRPVNVEFEASPPLTLAETRRRPFETRTAVYAFIAGMCGVGMHTTGELHRMDLKASRKAVDDWWDQMFVAQELCTQMRDFVALYPATTPSVTRQVREILATDRELFRFVSDYKSRMPVST
ncbi:hypothetical protein [Pseudomonas migulae]|uniref:Uncharacterized protein n=1 Tax=Pseudomonas migulae TaxID=78543 RepID=A0ABY8MLW8_9PSED|nr:hypothetical protein [Pseudomonas migulae]WGK88330.1 hypothetical protein MOQ58_17510 [Pseudomonas migulae]